MPRDLIECPLTLDRGMYYHHTIEQWRPSQISGDWAEIVARVDRVNDLFDEGRDDRASPERVCLRAPSTGALVIRPLAELAA